MHKNVLRDNSGTENCNRLQKSSLKEYVNMEIKREHYLVQKYLFAVKSIFKVVDIYSARKLLKYISKEGLLQQGQCKVFSWCILY